jgi:hypothetical protein
MNFLPLYIPIIVILLIPVAFLISVVFIRGGVIAKRGIQDLNGEDFPWVNPRNVETWKFHVRVATQQSFLLGKFILISMLSLGAGINIFLCIFIPTSLFSVYIFYRIWRNPNDYQKEIGITKADIWAARKESSSMHRQTRRFTK